MEGYKKAKQPIPPAHPTLAARGRLIDWFWLNPGPDDYIKEAEAWDVPYYVADARLCATRYLGLMRKPFETGKFLEGKALKMATPVKPGEYRIKDAQGQVQTFIIPEGGGYKGSHQAAGRRQTLPYGLV